jgi:hypothetical protein
MYGDRLQGPETAQIIAATRDAEQRQSIVDVFIVALLALTAAVALLSVLSTVRATYPHAGRDLAGTLALLIVLVVGWWLNRRGRVDAAIWLCLAAILLGATFFFDGRTLDRTLIIYTVPVAAAAFLLRPRMAFVLAGLALADYTVVWAAYGWPADYNYLSMFALAALALLAYLVAAHWRDATEVQEEYRAELERDVAERERVQEALMASEQELRGLAEQRHAMLLQLVDAMVAAVELHDPGSSGHQRRVAQLSAAIGKELGMSAAELRTLWMAAALHDVGMAAVPALIVTKPGALSDAEYDVVKQHPELARPVLQRLESAGPLADIVSEHHERLDGSGYPHGLRAQAIRREARIVAVADTVEAMMSGRPYHAAADCDAALSALRAGSGTLYDADAVAACGRVFEQGFRFAS